MNNLSSRSADSSPAQIILWWESRRIAYNIAVGVVGFISVTLLLTIGRHLVSGDEPLLSPFFQFLGILAYGVAANICYTAGWVVELTLRKFSGQNTDKFAIAAYKTGLVFSCLLTSLPIWFVLALWISHSR